MDGKEIQTQAAENSDDESKVQEDEEEEENGEEEEVQDDQVDHAQHTALGPKWPAKSKIWKCTIRNYQRGLKYSDNNFGPAMKSKLCIPEIGDQVPKK